MKIICDVRIRNEIMKNTELRRNEKYWSGGEDKD